MVGNEFLGGGGKPCNTVTGGLTISKNSMVSKSGYFQDASTKQLQDEVDSGIS